MGLFHRTTQAAAWELVSYYTTYDEHDLPAYNIDGNAALPDRNIVAAFRPIPHPEQSGKWTVLNETNYLVTRASEVPWSYAQPSWPATPNSPPRTLDDAVQEAHRAAVSACSPAAAQQHTWDGEPFRMEDV